MKELLLLKIPKRIIFQLRTQTPTDLPRIKEYLLIYYFQFINLTSIG